MEEKKTIKKRKNNNQHTVSISSEMMDNMQSLKEKSMGNLTISKIIDMALDNFFNADDNKFGNLFPEGLGSVLIPIDKYGAMFTFTNKNIKDKISTGKLTCIELGRMEYIVMEEDDVKNFAFQIVNMKSKIEKLTKRIEVIEKK